MEAETTAQNSAEHKDDAVQVNNSAAELEIIVKKRKLFSKANLRVFALLLTIGAFLLGASILAIHYARGFLPTDNGIVETGNIRINSEPVDVNVLLDNKAVTLTNRLITGLQPGNYTITVNQQGYLPWEKSVEVRAGIVKDLYIKLYPESLKLSQFTKTNIDSAVFADNGEYAYYVVKTADKGEDIGLWRQRLSEPGAFDIFNNGAASLKISNLTSLIKEPILAGEYKLLPSPDNRRLVLQTGTGAASKTYVLQADVYNEPTVNNSLEAKLNFSPATLTWFNVSDNLILQAGNLLSDYNIAENRNTVIDFTPNNNPVYGVSRTQVFFYNQAAQKLYSYVSGRTTPIALANVQLQGNISQLFVSYADRDELYYRNESGSYYYLDVEKSYQYPLPAGSTIKSVATDGNSVLYTDTAGSYFALSIEEIAALNRFITEIKPVNLPNAEKISAAKFSHSSDSLLLLNEAHELYLSDKDGGNPVKVVAGEAVIENGSFEIEPGSNRLYVLLIEASSVNSATITPEGEENEPQNIEDKPQNLYYVDLKAD